MDKQIPDWTEVFELVSVPPARPQRGSEIWCAKLDDLRAAAVKRALVEGVPGRALARLFGLSEQAIASVAKGRTWTHVPWPAGYGPRRNGSYEL